MSARMLAEPQGFGAGLAACVARDAPGGDSSDHVRLTREIIDSDPCLDQLLALTRGIATAGAPALRLVLPALAPVVRHDWLALTGLAKSARDICDVGDRLERDLGEVSWSPDAIDAALVATASAFESRVRDLRAVVSVLVLGERTPLPVAPVLAIMGSERMLARLRSATRDFKAMQMVG